MTKRIIFIGSVKLDVLKYFKSKDYNCGLMLPVKSKSDPTPAVTLDHQDEKRALLDFVLPVNMNNKETVQSSLKGFYIHPETMFYSDEDRYLLVRAYIAETLENTTNDFLTPASAIAVTSKLEQREIYSDKCPEITVPYRKVRTFHGAYMFCRKHGYPVIIKPVHLSMSQLVDVAYDLEDLITKASYIFDHVEEAYRLNNVKRTPIVMVEKFIEGRQFSVDSYVDQKGKVTHTPICEQVLSKDLGGEGFETVYSGYPANLTKTQEKDIFEVVEKCLAALEVTGNPAHTEVKLTPEGEVKIVETNLRVGGMRASLLGEGYGIDHLKNAVNVVLGDELGPVSHKVVNHTTAPQVWPDEIGELVEVQNADKVKDLDSYVYDYVSKKFIGQTMGPADKGYPRTYFAILAHKDQKQLEKDRQWILDNVKSIVKTKKK